MKSRSHHAAPLGEKTAPSPWFPDGQPEPMVLASASPRRRDLLRQVGLRFAQVISSADEAWPEGLSPEEAVKEIALRKALSIASEFPDALVIGADTAVILDGEVLGKPSSVEEATHMLGKLAGRTHCVVTGIALVDGLTGLRLTDAAITEVVMRRASQEELRAYAASGEPDDKAGAYGIQGLGAGLVTEIRGCYFNVVGMPVSRLIERLHEAMDIRRKRR